MLVWFREASKMTPSSSIYTLADRLKPSSIGTLRSWDTAFWPSCFDCLVLLLPACLPVFLRFGGIVSRDSFSTLKRKGFSSVDKVAIQLILL